jgi:hypothetical protein
LRRTLARHVTIDQACRRLGVDPQKLLDALNTTRGEDDVDGCCSPAGQTTYVV